MARPKGSVNKQPKRSYFGRTYGYLTVIGHAGWFRSEYDKSRRSLLLCRCVCGREVPRRLDTLRKLSSCGCINKAKAAERFRGNTNMRRHVLPGTEATESPTLRDIAWAAGFYEGEGTVWCTNEGEALAVKIVQVNKWPIDRMRALFGGTIGYNVRRAPRRPTYIWQASGARARGFLMTIYKFLSPRRQAQILSNGYSFRDAPALQLTGDEIA